MKKEKRFVCFCFFTSLCLPYSLPSTQSVKLQEDKRRESFSVEGQECNLSYEVILKNYYKLAIGENKTPSLTFEQFYFDFYAEDSDRDLIRFTLDCALENGNYDEVYEKLIGDNNAIAPLNSSFSQDEDYILLDSQYTPGYTSSSLFARRPLYMCFDYSNVKAGDIVYETDTKFFDTGHCAIIENRSQVSAFGAFTQTIEAVGSGVKRGFVDDLRMVQFKCYILRVNYKEFSQSNTAIEFARKQVGKPYSLNILRLCTSIDAKEWYCSELVYAAWKYAGVDIGVRMNGNGELCYLSKGCLPSDIDESINTSRLTISDHYEKLLAIDIIQKIENQWCVEVTNLTSQVLYVHYNAKLCNYSDAENWTHLHDIKDVILKGNENTHLHIFDNLLATTMAFSILDGDSQVLIYADELTEDGGLKLHYNVIHRDKDNDKLLEE